MSEFGRELRRLLDERGISYREIARQASYDFTYISKVVNGHKPGSVDLARKLDEILGTDGLLTGMLNGGLNPDDAGRLRWVIRHPRHIDQAAVDSLSAVLGAQRQAEDAMGAAAVKPAVKVQLRAVNTMATEAFGPVRSAVVDVAAQWAQFAGWLALQTDDLADCDARFSQAIHLAAEIDDETMTATVLSFRGYAAWRAGDPGPVVGLAQAAQRRGVALSQRAYAAGLEARGLAMIGDAEGAERKVDLMVERSADLASQPDQMLPPWLYWYTPAFFACQRGIVLGYFAAIPRYHQLASEALASGYDELPASGKTSEWGAGYLVHLGAAHARAGDVEAACDAALRAAAIGRQLTSEPLTTQLSRLRQSMARRWPDDARIAQLDDALH